MLWLIFILLLVDLFCTLGLVGSMSELSKKIDLFVGRDAKPHEESIGDFIKTPAKKYRTRKKK